MKYIEIMGASGSGKTSLAKALAEETGYATLLESEEDLKNLYFFEEYMADPDAFGFEGALNFLALHLNRIQEGIRRLPPETEGVIVDTSFVLQYAYALAMFQSPEQKPDLEVISSIIDRAHAKLPDIDLRINIQLPLDVLFDRVTKRGRESDKNVPKEFLANTQAAIADALQAKGGDVKLLNLSGSYNWIDDKAHKRQIADMVHKRLGSDEGPILSLPVKRNVAVKFDFMP